MSPTNQSDFDSYPRAAAPPIGERLQNELAEASQQLSRLRGQAMQVLREHPAACLLGAVAAGFLAGRLLLRR